LCRRKWGGLPINVPGKPWQHTPHASSRWHTVSRPQGPPKSRQCSRISPGPPRFSGGLFFWGHCGLRAVRSLVRLGASFGVCSRPTTTDAAARLAVQQLS
jgi:hypothetical protein